MTTEELLEKLNTIQAFKCETQTLEIKAARQGCPKRLYDTLSGFSNQDEGGTIIFGVDEDNDFEECGVYNPQDIQKKIIEQCAQMEPRVRPLLSVAEKEGKFFVSAEIPGIDIAERPCYYKGQGRLKGSHIRVGDSDEPMTDYEVYSYEAFRKKYQDDVRPVPRASFAVLDKTLLADYVQRLKAEKPNFSALSEQEIFQNFRVVLLSAAFRKGFIAMICSIICSRIIAHFYFKFYFAETVDSLMYRLKNTPHLFNDRVFGIETAHLFEVTHCCLCSNGYYTVLFSEAVGINRACEYL